MGLLVARLGAPGGGPGERSPFARPGTPGRRAGFPTLVSPARPGACRSSGDSPGSAGHPVPDGVPEEKESDA